MKFWRHCRAEQLFALLVALVVATPAAAVLQPQKWHWTQVRGHRMYYATRGSGPTLVLLHGGGDSGEHSFERQIGLFSEHFTIIAPDQIGQGHTPDVGGSFTYTRMMEDTATLLMQLKLKQVDVVGFSDGGILALMLAVRHPELVHRLVVSGVNISPDGLTADELEGLRTDQTKTPRTIDEKLAKLWYTSPTNEELSLAMLSKIQQPALVISGDHDVINLDHTLQIYRALPHGQLCVLPDTDHLTFANRPEWINPIVASFLEQN